MSTLVYDFQTNQLVTSDTQVVKQNVLGKGSYSQVVRGKIIDTIPGTCILKDVAIKSFMLLDSATNKLNASALASAIVECNTYREFNSCLAPLYQIRLDSKNYTLHLIQEMGTYTLNEYTNVIRPSMQIRLQLCMDMLRDIVPTLAQMHAGNTFVRDLKPDNILMFQSTSGLFTFKLTDMGLSKCISHIPVCLDANTNSKADSNYDSNSDNRNIMRSDLQPCNPYFAPEYVSAGAARIEHERLEKTSGPSPNLPAISNYGLPIDMWALGCTLCETLSPLDTPQSLYTWDTISQMRKKGIPLYEMYYHRLFQTDWLKLVFLVAKEESEVKITTRSKNTHNTKSERIRIANVDKKWLSDEKLFQVRIGVTTYAMYQKIKCILENLLERSPEKRWSATQLAQYLKLSSNTAVVHEIASYVLPQQQSNSQIDDFVKVHREYWLKHPYFTIKFSMPCIRNTFHLFKLFCAKNTYVQECGFVESLQLGLFACLFLSHLYMQSNHYTDSENESCLKELTLWFVEPFALLKGKELCSVFEKRKTSNGSTRLCDYVFHIWATCFQFQVCVLM